MDARWSFMLWIRFVGQQVAVTRTAQKDGLCLSFRHSNTDTTLHFRKRLRRRQPSVSRVTDAAGAARRYTTNRQERAPVAGAAEGESGFP